MILRYIEIQTATLANRSFNPKPKVKVAKEHPRFPWIEADDGTRKKIGDRGKRSSEDVMAFLKTL